MVQRRCKNFPNGDENFEEEKGQRMHTTIDTDLLKTIIKADLRKATHEFSVEP